MKRSPIVASRDLKMPVFKGKRPLLQVLSAALMLPLIGQAATKTWVGNTSALWNVPANWSGGVPANGDSIVFGAPSLAGAGPTGTTLVNDIASLTLGGANTDAITFGLAASPYILTRQAAQVLTLGSSGTGVAIKDLSLFAQSITAPITFSGNQTFQVGGTTGAAMSQLSVSGGISGGRLTKTGTGMLILGNNQLSGLDINMGVVSVGADTQLGAVPASFTPGSITINGGVLRTNIASMTINAKRGILLGDGTAGSGGTILISQGTTIVPVFPATASGTYYNGVIANNGGTNSLTKTGLGVLFLGGQNTYTGATKVNQGILALDFTTDGAPTSNIISSSSQLILGGVPNSASNTGGGNPSLYVQGSNVAETSQTFNGLTLAKGNSNLIARGGNSTFNTTVNLGGITHELGGTVGFSQLSGGSTGQGNFTTTASNTNGILGAWATIASTVGTGTTALAQTDWASVDGSGNIVAYTGYTTLTGATPGITSSATSNVRISGASTLNATLAAGTTDVNTILMNDTVSRTVTIGTGNTLRFGANGGVWKSSTTNTGITFSSGGILTAGGAPNTAGEITFNANGSGASTQAIVVNSVVADNGTGAVTVTKTGVATMNLTANNTYSGGTFINQGTINATVAGAFGTGAVTISGGTSGSLGGTANLTATAAPYANDFFISGNALTLQGGSSVSGTITMLGDSLISSNAQSGSLTGKLTGDYNLSFFSGTFTVSNINNDYGGNLTLNGQTGSPLNLKLGNNEVLANGVGKGNVIIAASGTAVTSITTLDLNGKTETINGLVSAGTAAQLVSQVIVTNTDTGAASLTIGDNDQSATYAGLIKDGAGTVAITKIGAGTQTFSGANTYTGNTTVAAGTLLLSSTAVDSTISGSAVIDVRSGATLNVASVTTANGFVVGSTQTLIGNGTVVGNTTVVGNLAPGASPGLLTFANNLTLTGTAVTTMEIIGTSRGVVGGYDAINLGTTSVLTYDGTLTLSMSGLIAGGTYDLFNFTTAAAGAFDAVTFGGGFYSGTWTTAGAGVWTASSNGQSFSFSEATGDLMVVPEPTTWALLGLGLVAVVLMRRRRMVA